MMLADWAQMQIISQETTGTLATLFSQRRAEPSWSATIPSPPIASAAGFGTITAAQGAGGDELMSSGFLGNGIGPTAIKRRGKAGRALCRWWRGANY